MLPSTQVRCPYCGETIELLLDASAGAQRYIEDCAVCCRPIMVSVVVGDDGGASVSVASEHEA